MNNATLHGKMQDDYDIEPWVWMEDPTLLADRLTSYSMGQYANLLDIIGYDGRYNNVLLTQAAVHNRVNHMEMIVERYPTDIDVTSLLHMAMQYDSTDVVAYLAPSYQYNNSYVTNLLLRYAYANDMLDELADMWDKVDSVSDELVNAVVNNDDAWTLSKMMDLMSEEQIRSVEDYVTWNNLPRISNYLEVDNLASMFSRL